MTKVDPSRSRARGDGNAATPARVSVGSRNVDGKALAGAPAALAKASGCRLAKASGSRLAKASGSLLVGIALGLPGCVGHRPATQAELEPALGYETTVVDRCLASFCALAAKATRPTASRRLTAKASTEEAVTEFDAPIAEQTSAPAPEESPLDADNADETPREHATLTDGDWRRLAVRFDRWLFREMGDGERQSYENECRQSRTDPFCFSVKNASRLEQYVARLQRPYGTPPVRVVEPTPFKFRGKTLMNWNVVRKAELPALLAGLKTLEPAQRAVVENRSLGEKRCPNRVSIALAALLEDDAKDRAGYRRVARLFEKGARCTHKHKEARDRENYLTRAALYRWRAKDYGTVVSLLSGAKPTDAYSGRALYWLLRAQTQLGQTRAATKTYRRLRSDHALSFHAILAAVERGDDPGHTLGTTTPPLSGGTRKKPVARFIAQIEQLRAAGRQRSADIVARLALESRFRAETDARVYIASLADPYLKVTTMSSLLIAERRLWTRPPMQVAYPTDYLPAARSAVTGLSSVDPFFLLALCRKESAFDPRAVSTANAQGLCQIQPATARRIVGNDAFDLFDPAQNMRIGARYLQLLMSEFEGNPALAAAAYNAGEEAVRRWRHRLGTVTDPVLFLDLTPYRETRDYVAQVLGNYYWYRRLYADDGASAIRSLIARK
jgi:soluble lytic murein transglycosylase